MVGFWLGSIFSNGNICWIFCRIPGSSMIIGARDSSRFRAFSEIYKRCPGLYVGLKKTSRRRISRRDHGSLRYSLSGLAQAISNIRHVEIGSARKKIARLFIGTSPSIVPEPIHITWLTSTFLPICISIITEVGNGPCINPGQKETIIARNSQ